MVKFAGIEFAPLSVPFERRIQTLSAFIYVYMLLFSGITGIVSFIVVSFILPGLAFGYVMWYIFTFNACHNGSLRLHWTMNRTTFKDLVDYFPIKLIKTAELPHDRNYILGCHPHGLFCFGVVSSLATHVNHFTELFPGITAYGMTLTSHFYFPITRDFLLFSGTCSSSQESFKHILTKSGVGNAALLIVGGSSEMMEAHPGTAVLNLKNRKGFIKTALMYGASLVPVFSFGENDVYDQMPNPEGSLLRKLQNKCKDIVGIPFFLINGRGFFQYSFGLLPRRRPIYVVVGKPIEVEKTANPEEELIDKYHAMYIEALQSLFDEYKVKLGDVHKDLQLKIK